ncbi:tetraacyldisaccharide 4'-kinase [Coralliovum pocilloporae]|uniref:tetraacyldisaccharide 4'-kinase n=1 Tax=Coralliovum pocilloporae TaxID=3066369 RepID=UPI003307B1DC
MKAPSFWWRRAGFLALVFLPISIVIALVARLRFRRKGKSFDIPVICVGNPVAGGAGKTPTAIALAALLKEAGYNPVFVSRGYRGRLSGPVVVDPQRHRARDVGDEPLLLVRTAPTIVSKDRAAAVALAEKEGYDAVIMDDGFQNPSLTKDYSFLVVDARRGVGNGLVMPSGPLRAPLGDQLDRADSLVVIGHAPEAQTIVRPAAKRAMRIFEAAIAPDKAVVERLGDLPIVAYAGLGRPSKLFDTLKEIGKPPVKGIGFPDHHRFKPKDANRLLTEGWYHAARLVTTEKDMTRLPGDETILGELKRNSIALPVTLTFDDRVTILRELKPIIERQRRRRRAP